MRSTAPERHLPSIALVLTQAAASGRSNRLRYHPYSQNPSSSANQDGHMVDPPLALRLCSVLSFLMLIVVQNRVDYRDDVPFAPSTSSVCH